MTNFFLGPESADLGGRIVCVVRCLDSFSSKQVQPTTATAPRFLCFASPDSRADKSFCLAGHKSGKVYPFQTKTLGSGSTFGSARRLKFGYILSSLRKILFWDELSHRRRMTMTWTEGPTINWLRSHPGP